MLSTFCFSHSAVVTFFFNFNPIWVELFDEGLGVCVCVCLSVLCLPVDAIDNVY